MDFKKLWGVFFFVLIGLSIDFVVAETIDQEHDKRSVKERLGDYAGEDILSAVEMYNETASEENKIVCSKNEVFGLHRSGLICSTDGDGDKDRGEMSDEDMDKVIAAYNEMMRDRNKLICKREKATGTRISKRVCRTKWSIMEDQRKAKDMLDLLDRKKIPIPSANGR